MISAARAAAFDILLRVEQQSSYASELLHSAGYETLSVSDHGLATELVMGVLRWRSRLDTQIASVSSLPLNKLDVEVLTALRLGLYQLRWLDRIPAHAAIHESVELVKRSRKRSAAPFVNALLRKFSTVVKPENGKQRAGGRTDHDGDEGNDLDPEKLAQAFAHPLWLVQGWTERYGLETAREICKYDQTVPVTALRISSPAVENDLRSAGVTLLPGHFLASARRVHSGDIFRIQEFVHGEIVIQDEASQLVAELLGKGMRILDCCAAPGGKTLAIANRNPRAEIVAADLHPHRARLLNNLMVGKGAAAKTRVIAADARALPFNQKFDRVLVDVPCSGTGTLARNPEIKWRLTPEDLHDLHARQLAILQSAMASLADNGKLIYSTCSLETLENECVVEKVLAKEKSFRLIDCQAELERLKAEGELTWTGHASLTSGPYLRTVPGVHLCDGFFAAILEKL